MVRGIDDEPVFALWVPYTLRKRDVIISGLNTCVKRKTHKYGIEVSKNTDEAMDLDRANGNEFWTNAVNLEISSIGIAFGVLEAGRCPPPR